jgi:peptidoglycan/xylan/chitin deacetylase (PgdA/CDA1 family)
MKVGRKDVIGFIMGVIVAVGIVSFVFAGCSNIAQKDFNTSYDVQNIDNIKKTQQRDLILGTTGADVWDLHQRLYELMPNNITKELATTDVYDETTQFYVTLFQLTQDLEPNGTIDDNTRIALNNNPVMPSEDEFNIFKSMILIDEDNENDVDDNKNTTINTKIAYLTFDDGPDPTYTPQIVELLNKYNASATFFALGQEVDKFPELAKEVSINNQVVANHTYSHIDIMNASETVVQEDIKKANKAVQNATGKKPICFRPPYDAIDNEIKQKIGNAGGQVVMWDVDTQDWARPGVDVIVEHILDYAQSGEVILMHDGGGNRSQTVEALEILLPEMIEKGWKFRAMDCVR